MANSNDMLRSDADKSHVGADMLVLDSVGDLGKVPIQGKIVAWCNFDGSASSITPRASANVSSITDNGTGSYTVNLSEAQPDAHFGVHVTATDDNTRPMITYESGTYGQNRTSSAVNIITYGYASSGATVRDAQGIYVTVVR